MRIEYLVEEYDRDGKSKHFIANDDEVSYLAPPPNSANSRVAHNPRHQTLPPLHMQGALTITPCYLWAARRCAKPLNTRHCHIDREARE